MFIQLRSIPKTRIKIMMNNNGAAIVSNAASLMKYFTPHKIYKSFPHCIPTTSLKGNSLNGRHHTSNTEHRLQQGVQMIREVLTSKARGYVNMEELRATLQKLPTKYFTEKEDIYKKFKGKSSQLSIQEPEEEILLDEDCSVISKQLRKISLNYIAEQSKARMIMENTTLHNPYHLDNVKEWPNELQELAKVGFDMAQMAYINEVQQISLWKDELNLDKELQFARIKPFKWCMWSMGILPRLNMSEERLLLAKPISFSYMIDDIFDGLGTYDELYLFTEAINRWESADVSQLPNCMKVCFKALLEMTNDFSSKIQAKHGWNPEQCLQKLWAKQCNAYLTELKWSLDKYSPTSEEYLSNGIISSGTHLVLAHAYFLMGEGISKKSLEELNSLPSIISSTATILRLWNDAGNHMDRTPNGEDGSYVDWYMKEHKIGSYDIARQHVSLKISEAWKCLEKEYMSSTSPFSKDFKAACLNLARTVHIMYGQDESESSS